MRNGIFTVKINTEYRTDQDLRNLISGIDQMIGFLNQQAIQNVGNSGFAEYELDTGQTRVKKKFNSIQSILAAVKEYEMMRQMYVNKLNKTTGRYTLMDARNFKPKCGR